MMLSRESSQPRSRVYGTFSVHGWAVNCSIERNAFMKKNAEHLTQELLALPSTAEHFTRLVKTPHGYTKFFFNRLRTAEGIQYHVSCLGPNRRVYSFQMAEILWQWHITSASKCPQWIKDLESSFGIAILDSRSI